MAVAVKPSKSLLNIRSGIKSIKNSFSGLRKNAGNLNDVVLKKTKVKRESIVRNAILSQRRQEQERRKNKEDLLEASTIGGAVKRQAKAVASSTKGFLGRIMDFLATLLVGWLLTNLPSIITMAQELIARIQRLYTIVTGFFDNTIKLFRGFGNLLGAVGKNILTFDFTDSKGRVESSLKDLGGTFEDMQNQFDEGFKLLTTSLGEGVVSGEDAAPFGTQYENESMQQQPSGSSGGKGRYGTSEERALLDSIAYAEGNTDWSTWAGYQKHGPDDLTGLTIRQIHDLQTTFISSGKVKKTGSAVVGRYQFKDLLYHAKGAGLNPETDKFSPANQDKMAIAASKRRGVTNEMLKKEGLSTRVADLLAPEWASFPYSPKGGKSYYGQGYKDIKKLQGVYAKSLGTQSTSQQTPVVTAPAPSTPARGISTTVKDEINVAGPRGGTARVGLTPGQGYLARGGSHKGIDIGTNYQKGYYVSLKLSGTVDYIGWDKDGYGHFVDIKSGNTIYRFAHLAKVMVKRGQPYNGETIGEIGNTGNSYGEHLHYEVRINGKDVNPRPYLGLLSIGKQLIGAPGQPAQISTPTPTPAQIASPGTQQRRQASQQLAQQPAGPSIVIIEEEPPAPQPQGSIGGGGAMMIPIVINPLNSFITKKLLLDLAYT
jgi:murein DD-endopeptidase MepM/ murein hydrolase activator NlpD